MTNEEKEHYLSVLVELQLLTITRAISEGNIEDKDVQKEKQILKFIKELPPYLSEIPNVEQKVREILERTEKNAEEIRRLQQKHDRQRDLGEER